MKLGALEICKATRDKIAQRLHLAKKNALCFSPIQQSVCAFESVGVFILLIKIKQASCLVAVCRLYVSLNSS